MILCIPYYATEWHVGVCWYLARQAGKFQEAATHPYELAVPAWTTRDMLASEGLPFRRYAWAIVTGGVIHQASVTLSAESVEHPRSFCQRA